MIKKPKTIICLGT